MRVSETGLSTTTTSSGLFDEARTRPQVPSSTVTRTPLTVTRSRIFWPLTVSPLFCAPPRLVQEEVDGLPAAPSTADLVATVFRVALPGIPIVGLGAAPDQQRE